MHEINQKDLGPYWKRVHRDWRFWVGVALMAIAIAVYITSDNLAFVPHN
jgi:hypothetical protein